MCNQWMYSCGEVLTNGQDRLIDLSRLWHEGCTECGDEAMTELIHDKKVPHPNEVGEE